MRTVKRILATSIAQPPNVLKCLTRGVRGTEEERPRMLNDGPCRGRSQAALARREGARLCTATINHARAGTVVGAAERATGTDRPPSAILSVNNQDDLIEGIFFAAPPPFVVQCADLSEAQGRLRYGRPHRAPHEYTPPCTPYSGCEARWVGKRFRIQQRVCKNFTFQYRARRPLQAWTFPPTSARLPLTQVLLDYGVWTMISSPIRAWLGLMT